MADATHEATVPTPNDFFELLEQAQFAAETGGTVHDADPDVILALFEEINAGSTTAEEGVESVADLRTQLAITSLALRSACNDGWADGEGAMSGYLLRAAVDLDESESESETGPDGADDDAPVTPGEAQTGEMTQADETDEADDEGLLEHGWRLRQDEPLPDHALEVIESLASTGASFGAGTVHAAGADDDDRAISTFGVLLDDQMEVGVAVDCSTGVIRWVTRPAERD